MPQIQGSYIPSGATRYMSAAAEQIVVIKATPGKLHCAVVCNIQAASRWLFVFNALVASAVLVMPPILIPAGGFASIDLSSLPFDVACTFASSTAAVYAVGGNDFHILAFTS